MGVDAVRDFVKRGLGLARLTAFDESTESGRSRERYRRAALTTVATFGARGAQILTSLITVPLTLRFLGQERYGMWMTMSSVMAMFAFADLGIGNGLLNAISHAKGREDADASVDYVSSAFFVLAGIAAAIAVVFAVAYPFVPWASIFNVHSARAVREAGPTIAVFVGSLVFGIPMGVVQRVRIGLQEGFVDSLWGIGASLAGLVAVLVAVYAEASLPMLIGALVLAPATVQIGNFAYLFLHQRRSLLPKLSHVRRAAVKTVMATGAYFFVLQIAGAVAYQSDALILAQILGPEAVTKYAIPMKLFWLTPMLLGIVYASLWPAYGESVARGDMSWASRALARSFKLGMAVSIPVTLFLIATGRTIIRLWVGPEVVPTLLLLVAAGLWAICSAGGGAAATFLNGAGVLRFQTICAVLMMVANVGISIMLTKLVGISGVLWGSVTSQLVFVLIPDAVYIRMMLTGRIVPLKAA